MSTTAEKIVTEALGLPPEVRAFVAETLIDSLGAPPATDLSPEWGEEIRRWETQVHYFLRTRSELVRQYGDRWVAIKDEAVVDTDDDRLALMTRINGSFPTEVVLVVRPIAGHRVVELPSPEYRP